MNQDTFKKIETLLAALSFVALIGFLYPIIQHSVYAQGTSNSSLLPDEGKRVTLFWIISFSAFMASLFLNGYRRFRFQLGPTRESVIAMIGAVGGWLLVGYMTVSLWGIIGT